MPPTLLQSREGSVVRDDGMAYSVTWYTVLPNKVSRITVTTRMSASYEFHNHSCLVLLYASTRFSTYFYLNEPYRRTPDSQFYFCARLRLVDAHGVAEPLRQLSL